MKNKNAFTLVELLAVIAILAILVIIALPNVLKLFNEAKKNTFLTEARTIYKEATKKYINESVKGNNIKTISSSESNKLNLNGEQLDYCITLDSKGKVTSMKVSNGDYYIEYDGSKIEDLEITDVKEGTIDTSTCKVKIEIPPNPCTYDGELVQGAEYVNGQYTYRYMQEVDWGDWSNITEDGWGVKLTDRYSTDPVTTKLCTSINEKPIVSMSYMFEYIQATELDLSSFDTSNVTNMTYMFANSDSDTTTILGLNNFDTSNVTDMSFMFYFSSAKTLDLSSFDTSKVTNMDEMFDGSQATTLDLRSFDTSNVTNMCSMFMYSQATEIKGLNKFNTSNVTDMNGMFSYTKMPSLDLSSFDTSNVTDMGYMFNDSQITELDLSSFDTSNVTDMRWMFYKSQATTITGLNKFNTSNVTNMSYMFYLSQATTLGLSSFDTSNVGYMDHMFERCKAITLDLSSFDTSNVTNMNGMFTNSNIKTIYVGDGWSTDSLILTGWNRTSDLFQNATNLVGGAGTVYNESNPVDKTYARVDDPANGKPGYFTYKASN